MTCKPLSLLLPASLLALSFPALAVADDNDGQIAGGTISGKLTFATDYVFRGESETLDGEIPVVQGTLGWSNPQGWYGGLYASNIKFRDPNLEIVTAPYIGKFGEFGQSGFSYDVMVFSYLYPNASYANYTELWLRVGKTFGAAKLQLEVTPTLDDWFGVTGWHGVNYAIHPSYTLPGGFNLSGSVGYQDLYSSDNAAEGWTHWNLGLGKHYLGLDFDLRYHGSTVDKDHKVYGDQTVIFDDRLVFGVSKSF
ncbi:TMAO reductase system porin TorF [Shewanella sp. NFH-SH190041]|uniref:TorF family putative porin n=1 Tax=Shewanella sp. NFH-SH190041 TaxID=2950245 RepID=UPI0021C36440|nr:TorF family putative porin [Shewanella sp. NFH-SH190041]BDM62808.1 TMAO reductase system porin TorF [Shewanella sp. NFH-SH190041]